MRLPLQRERLLRAAALEFAERGYAGSSSESISRRAAMSKATFYEHFANKEECMLALFDLARRVVQEAMATAASRAPEGDARERMRAGTRAFLTALSEHPEFAQTLLVEIIGAGPRAAQRRDMILQAFADVLDAENAAAARRGLIGRFGSPHDPFAVVGAITELVSRQVRLGVPEDVLDLAPVIDRLILGLLPRS
ncbi:MAG TPA: helix-turn-helix domain-containing protein [Solirubrobacteraceae bacterium]